MEWRKMKTCLCADIRSFKSALFFSLLIPFIWGCYPFSSNKNLVETVQEESIVLIDSAYENFSDLFEAPTTLAFYNSRGFVPAWSTDKSKTIMADSMINLIRSARAYGLFPNDYHWPEIQMLMDTASAFNENFRLRRLDLLLTDAFFTMSTHLSRGRLDATTLERRVPMEIDSAKILFLNEAINGNGLRKMLELQEPAYSSYRQLREALNELLQKADSSEREALYSGITIDSLEVSSKVAAVEINLERWRWETGLKDRFIVVNIPSFTMTVVESDSVIMESKVIVGSNKTQTPVLDAVIRSFTIYPYWNVPREISINEILPHIKRDSNYLDLHRYEVLDIHGNVLNPSSLQWRQFHKNNFPVMIRQREGADNSLGIIKFSFKNKYGVYLHDTNARGLFNREKRALSHGCVRVEKFKELAHYLVRDDSVYCSPEDLDQYLQLKRQQIINVVNPVALHIRYLTCEYRNGAIQFYSDVYSLDKQIKEALYRQPGLNKQLAMVGHD